MYAMKVVSSSIFHVMMFPLDGIVNSFDQLTYYEPCSSIDTDKTLPIFG